MRPDEILKSNIDDAITTLNRINGDGKLDYADYEEIFDAISTITDGVDFSAASPWHRVEEPPEEEGMYIVAVFFSGHWIFDAAWFTHDITEIYCVPCEKKISGFYRGNHEVHPDYWMPIEPPKEEA